MTHHPRELIVRSASALLRPGALYDSATSRLVNDLFRAADSYDGAAPAPPPDAELRAACDAFAKRIRTPAAALTLDERRLLHGDNSQIYNLAEGTGAAGGFLVPSLIAPYLVDKIKFFSSVATVARVIETDTGAPINVATTDDTAHPGTLLSEATLSPTVDFTFGQVTINAYKFTSGVTPISFEILQDSAVDLTAAILDLFGKRLGRGQNTYFTTGTGTAQPQGVVTGATLGFQLPVGSTTSLSYAGLIQLYQSVDPAYRSSTSCCFMMNDNTLQNAKLLLDSNGRALWLPDVFPQPPGSLFHGTLFGKSVIVNNDMANMAANEKCVLFGAFNRYAIRQVRGAEMSQLNDSAYAASGQSAWLAFSRADGRVVTPQAIKYLQNSAT